VTDIIELWRGERRLVALPARAAPVGGQTHLLSAAVGRNLAFTQVRVLRDGELIFSRNLDWRMFKGDGIAVNLEAT
jgi:hypothetical protein